MHIYAVNADNTVAITIGHTAWLDGKDLNELSRFEVYEICRPRRVQNHDAFISHFSQIGNTDSLHFSLEKDLPETCAKKRGYWESVNG